MNRTFFAIQLIILTTTLFSTAVKAEKWIWARGSLHAHTTNSDGDSPPQVVADWYRDNGYQFLAITDHEKLTDPAPLDKNPNDNFILISGEELAMPGKGAPIHANAFGIRETIKAPSRTFNAGRSVRRLVETIRNAGGIPMVNHPNWENGLLHNDLLYINGPYILEIANMGEGSKNEGNYARLSTEQIWDYLLSNGQDVYASATDDMHSIKDGPTGPNGPGKGWVVAKVRELTPQAVLASLMKGEFYSSTGVELADYSFDGRQFKVKVAPKPSQTYLIRFIGLWGSILQETEGTSATYMVNEETNRNSYVRCKVICSNGTVAWTQAYRIGKRSEK
ncbi:MAG: CehA/McbA family metallohydrolase [Armatimonadota bacterium]|nr:CehA/McbA family metallohydrolase [Armatimonadota bacterium]